MSPPKSLGWKRFIQPYSMILGCVLFNHAEAGASKKSFNGSDLINNYIRSKGYSSFIVFDTSNIKQFWIDKPVACINDSIFFL